MLEAIAATPNAPSFIVFCVLLLKALREVSFALLKKAIDNVKFVYEDGYNYSKYDCTSVQNYFNALIRGIHITYVVYESLEEYLLDINPKVF